MPRLREQGDLDDAGMTAMEREIMSALEAVAEEMRRGAPANSDALQSRLAALQRRPRTLAYAMRLIDHLAFAIRREGKYPSRPEFYRRLKTIEVLASRGRLPLARERLMQELADPQLFALLTNGDPRIERALLPTKKAIRRPSEPMRSIHLF